jgi:hypothetical protein
MMRMNRIQTYRKHHLPVNYRMDRMVMARCLIPSQRNFYPGSNLFEQRFTLEDAMYI